MLNNPNSGTAGTGSGDTEWLMLPLGPTTRAPLPSFPCNFQITFDGQPKLILFMGLFEGAPAGTYAAYIFSWYISGTMSNGDEIKLSEISVSGNTITGTIEYPGDYDVPLYKVVY